MKVKIKRTPEQMRALGAWRRLRKAVLALAAVNDKARLERAHQFIASQLASMT